MTDSDKDLTQRLRQYLNSKYEVTTCYNGLRDEAADRIDELVESNKELTLQLLAAHGQAADALDRLAKAVAEPTEPVKTTLPLDELMVSPRAPSTVLPNWILPPPKLSTMRPDCPFVTLRVEVSMDEVMKPLAAPLSPRLPPRPTYSCGKLSKFSAGVGITSPERAGEPRIVA